MASFNKAILMGNMVSDPEIRRVGDKDVAKFALAVNNPFKKGKVMYMECEYWRGGAVVAYMTKGTSILVDGELEQQSWEKDGQKRSRIVLQVQSIQLVGGKREQEEPELAGDFA